MYKTCSRMTVFFFGFLTLLVVARACLYEGCTCEEATIMCSDLGLTHIPSMTGTQIGGFTSLNFATNNITQVPAGSLPPALREIYLLLNPITTIDDTAFDASATTLEALFFSEAHFYQIPNAFLHLKTLKYLTIRDTYVLDWNEQVMNHTGQSVETLTLDNVGLTAWPTWIRYFSHLTELSLGDNSISLIPENALDELTNSITTLSLFKNNLTMIPKTVSKLKSLSMLHLHQNKITDVTWLPQSSKLSSLSLYTNNITDANHLSDSLRHYGDSMTELDVHENQLTSIPNLIFLPHVEMLDFSNNLISDPESGAFPSTINTLNMQHNNLPSIPYVMTNLSNVFEMLLSWNAIKAIRETDFSKTTTGVYLSYNLISQLTDNSFPPNSNIATLQLDNNPLVKISNLAFKNLPRLMDLNLQSTKLTRLPLTLASLNSVRFVDFTNNSGLICTCVEKSLESWVLALRNSIMGTCGQTDIYNFYLSLSPSCP